MNDALRTRFDRLLDDVIAELPDELKKLLEEVPLVVDDVPSTEIIKQLGQRDVRGLCGLYTGLPLTERTVWRWGQLPDKLRMFRQGVVNAATDSQGHLSDENLERQIRITVLHEMGHHFGLNEDDLRQLGYQ